jgi:hypothetical protein
MLGLGLRRCNESRGKKMKIEAKRDERRRIKLGLIFADEMAAKLKQWDGQTEIVGRGPRLQDALRGV